ncbi:hypothetical protein Arub01_43980 [Actinomadura rubrobrunea]|uniref:Histidine kinase/HSP90-like ATPase domain-containing protein n=1 Tax=Actinomadura rubrobrunea TaxID=115335 RepID=A0A9W6UWG5_9ACTN|nr:hypothetical protein Arub01_43980 [Actinomadura rubrobrunea]
MEINLDLRFPRDAASVPAARRLLDSSLCTLGVDAAIRGDIELLLTEACTNAIRHAADGEEYTVRVGILDEHCVIKVIDSGPGFGGDGDGSGPLMAEHGRGLLLMRALADAVRFGSVHPRRGALVALEKHLHYGHGSLGSRLADLAPDGRWDGGVGVESEPAPVLEEFATRMFELARAGRTEELAAHVDAGAPVNLTDDKGDTLLMLAACHGHAETVRALAARGADPDRANDRGQRPLAGMVFKQDPEVVRALLDAGADPHAGRPSAIDTAQMFGLAEYLAWFEEAAAT